MRPEKALRLIARTALLWYVLFIGVAAAAPVVAPEEWQAICSGASIKLVKVAGEDESTTAQDMGMKCPLCASQDAPPSPVAVAQPAASPFAHALKPARAAHIASITAPPLPGRGPPTARL